MATKVNKEIGDNTEEANEASLAGSGNLADAVKKLLKKGKERGFVTLDELNAVLPPERISSELIEDVMAQLNDMGINVVEGEDGDDSDGEAQPAADGASEGTATAEDYGRTDDPVRLYLREMGAVELLSREGEIAIAKRIEAGREMMIAGICESPLTIQAILDWNEALKEGRLLLRDIIDLEATQESPDGSLGDPTATVDGTGMGDVPAGMADSDAENEGEKRTDDAAENEGDTDGLSSFDDEDNISLAAIEEKLKPQVIETFDKIAVTYGKLNKLQHQRLVAIEKGEAPAKQSEAKMDGYKLELVELVRTVRFNNARLEQLVQQLYTLNRRLMGLEGRLLRLAVDVGLSREDFLERYYGHELDPNWYSYVLEKPPERPKEPPKPPRVVAPPRIDPKEVARQQKLELQRQQAEAKEMLKAEKARAAAEKAEAAAAEKEAKRIAAEAAKVKAAEDKAKADALKAKEREKAEALKAKEREKAQKEADRLKAAKLKEQERARAAAEKAKAQAAAAKAREAAKREAEKLKAQKAREAEQRRKEAEREKLARQKAAAAAKKAPAKKVAAKPVKKAAPAKKTAPAKKPAAKKAATKAPVRKSSAPAKPAVKKAVAKKPVQKPAPKKGAAKKR